MSFISADCDNLKKINDLYGHIVGDEYIRMSATMLRNVLGSSATLIRMGGDEFLAILPDTDERKTAEYMEQLQKHEKMFSIRNRTLSVSLGACTMHEPSGSFKEFIAISDTEMYRNKKARKAREAQE